MEITIMENFLAYKKAKNRCNNLNNQAKKN